MMRIETYQPEYAQQITDLFHVAVHTIARSIYSESQKEAWVPSPPNYPAWQDRLSGKYLLLVGIIDNHIASFIELDPNGHIDCCYTHPYHQRKGAATTLYRCLEQFAFSEGLSRLYVDASVIAGPFFQKQGFTLLRKNGTFRNGQYLPNFSIEKYLASGPACATDKIRSVSDV